MFTYRDIFHIVEKYPYEMRPYYTVWKEIYIRT